MNTTLQTYLFWDEINAYVACEMRVGVVDPKNWTLPLGVEFTRKEVYDAQEAQKF